MFHDVSVSGKQCSPRRWLTSNINHQVIFSEGAFCKPLFASQGSTIQRGLYLLFAMCNTRVAVVKPGVGFRITVLTFKWDV
jgi:hypothetical protein